MGGLLDKPITTKETESAVVAPSEEYCYRGDDANAAAEGGGGGPNATLARGGGGGGRNFTQYAASAMQGWRTEMEDEHIVAVRVSPSSDLGPNLSLFAVFDGHGGGFASSYAKNNLVRVLRSTEEFGMYASLPSQDLRDHEIGVDLLRTALINAFRKIDEEMRNCPERLAVPEWMKNPALIDEITDPGLKMAMQMEKERREEGGGDRSGCTGVVVVLTPQYIVCANAGDSRACLRTDGTTVQLSFDHKPHHEKEKGRIEAAGGHIREKRLQGDLAVSRGLGDFHYKDDPNLSQEEQKVSCIPDVLIRERDWRKDEFIVLACDGIWDALSCESCCDIIQARVLEEGALDMGSTCEHLLDVCLEKKSKDNMTAIIVGLHAMRKHGREEEPRIPSSLLDNFVTSGSDRLLMNTTPKAKAESPTCSQQKIDFNESRLDLLNDADKWKEVQEKLRSKGCMTGASLQEALNESIVEYAAQKRASESPSEEEEDDDDDDDDDDDASVVSVMSTNSLRSLGSLGGIKTFGSLGDSAQSLFSNMMESMRTETEDENSITVDDYISRVSQANLRTRCP